jgi:hypothetical protein
MAGSAGQPQGLPWRAMAIGSVAGLAVATVIAVLLVIFVPKDDADADASGGDDSSETPGAGGPATVDFTGTWTTNFSSIEMVQDGNKVTGDYARFLADNSPRHLEGTVTDRTLEGTFDGQNPFRFDFADDGSSFSGHWADPQGGLHEWCGALAPPLPDGCGYSGEWRVKGFPTAAALDGDSILLSQYGLWVNMRFDSKKAGEVDFDLALDSVTLAQADGVADLGGGTQIEFQFLVTEDPDWNSLKGTWKSGSQSGQWCAAQNGAKLPC